MFKSSSFACESFEGLSKCFLNVINFFIKTIFFGSTGIF